MTRSTLGVSLQMSQKFPDPPASGGQSPYQHLLWFWVNHSGCSSPRPLRKPFPTRPVDTPSSWTWGPPQLCVMRGVWHLRSETFAPPAYLHGAAQDSVFLHILRLQELWRRGQRPLLRAPAPAPGSRAPTPAPGQPRMNTSKGQRAAEALHQEAVTSLTGYEPPEGCRGQTA